MALRAFDPPAVWLICLAAVLLTLTLPIAYGWHKRRALAPRDLPVEVTLPALPAGTRPELLLVGDSRVAQWPIDQFGATRVGKLGLPGATSGNIDAATRERVVALVPQALVIQAGYNDASAIAYLAAGERDAALRRTVTRILGLATRAVAAGTECVIVSTVPPSIRPEWWRVLLKRRVADALTLELNRRLVAAVKQASDSAGTIALLDLDAGFRDAQGKLRAEYRSDASHWSRSGYLQATRMVRDALNGCRRPKGRATPLS